MGCPRGQRHRLCALGHFLLAQANVWPIVLDPDKWVGVR
jgi:hypothetical protein